eukprot:Skav221909  [mRNA]  locus=scaffold3925:6068:13822:- [translate_table: standard]
MLSSPIDVTRLEDLKVWARLLLQHITAPLELFDQAVDSLLHLAADAYTRVRQRGLLVLLQLSRANAQLVAKYPDALARFLLRLAQSSDPDAQQVGAEIAEHLKSELGDLAQGAALNGANGQSHQVQEANCEVIEWPLDWKQN